MHTQQQFQNEGKRYIIHVSWAQNHQNLTTFYIHSLGIFLFYLLFSIEHTYNQFMKKEETIKL